jgi:hypothetical protein
MSHCPHCGCILESGKVRSNKAHSMLFAVIAEAWRQWPESHKFQPEDAEHLRAYLFVKARHYDAIDVKVKHTDAAILGPQLAALVKANADGKTPLLHAYSWGIRQFKPRTISGRPDSKMFHAVSSKCYSEIEAVIGVPVERMQRRAMRQAA